MLGGPSVLHLHPMSDVSHRLTYGTVDTMTMNDACVHCMQSSRVVVVGGGMTPGVASVLPSPVTEIIISYHYVYYRS